VLELQFVWMIRWPTPTGCNGWRLWQSGLVWPRTWSQE